MALLFIYLFPKRNSTSKRNYAACLIMSSASFLRDNYKDSENVSLLRRSLSDGHAIQRCIIYMYIIDFVITCYNCMMISSRIF